ncbi:MAG: sigma-70 family RNA polymerase sigma factor, partial [Candidatus Brocadiia bacterium]
RQSLVRLALAKCGNPEDAEEATNSAFLALWNEWANRSSTRTTNIVYGWLLTVAARRAMDIARSRKSRRSYVVSSSPDLLDTASDDNSPAEMRKAMLLLYEAIEELPAEQHEAVALYLADVPTAVAAEMLNVSSRTIRNRLEDARKLLATVLEKKGLALVAAIATLAAFSRDLAAEPPCVSAGEDLRPELQKTPATCSRVPFLLAVLILLAVGALFLYLNSLFNLSQQRIPVGGWHRTFGGPGIETFYPVASTNDGGIITGGATSSNTDTGNDWLVTRYDSGGNVVWARTFSGPKDENVSTITPLPNGNFLVAGCSNSFGTGWCNNTVLVELDANGHLLRQSAFSSPAELRPVQIIPLEPDGLMLLATASGYGTFSHDFDTVLFQLDTDWNVMSARAFGGPDRDHVMNMLPCADGGWVLGGWSRSFSHGDFDFCATRLSANLIVKWYRSWGTERSEESAPIIATSDGNYVLAGYSSVSEDDADVMALKFNPNGDLIWQNRYAMPFDQSVSYVLTERDGLYVFGGTAEFDNADPNKTDALLVALNPDGTLAFDRLFGGPEHDSVINYVNRPNGLLLSGTTCSFEREILSRALADPTDSVSALSSPFGAYGPSLGSIPRPSTGKTFDGWLVQLGPGFAFPADLKARPAGLKRVSGDLKQGTAEIFERDVEITVHEATMEEREWKP